MTSFTEFAGAPVTRALSFNIHLQLVMANVLQVSVFLIFMSHACASAYSVEDVRAVDNYLTDDEPASKKHKIIRKPKPLQTISQFVGKPTSLVTTLASNGLNRPITPISDIQTISNPYTSQHNLPTNLIDDSHNRPPYHNDHQNLPTNLIDDFHNRPPHHNDHQNLPTNLIDDFHNRPPYHNDHQYLPTNLIDDYNHRPPYHNDHQYLPTNLYDDYNHRPLYHNDHQYLPTNLIDDYNHRPPHHNLLTHLIDDINRRPPYLNVHPSPSLLGNIINRPGPSSLVQNYMTSAIAPLMKAIMGNVLMGIANSIMSGLDARRPSPIDEYFSSHRYRPNFGAYKTNAGLRYSNDGLKYDFGFNKKPIYVLEHLQSEPIRESSMEQSTSMKNRSGMDDENENQGIN